MNVEQPNHEPEDITLAGILVISFFSMCIGVFLGILVDL